MTDKNKFVIEEMSDLTPNIKDNPYLKNLKMN